MSPDDDDGTFHFSSSLIEPIRAELLNESPGDVIWSVGRRRRPKGEREGPGMNERESKVYLHRGGDNRTGNYVVYGIGETWW